MRLAIIDLGTNTFHLLIAEVETDGRFSTIERIRKYVYIGEEGVLTLGQKPMQRAYDTLKAYHDIILSHKVDKVIAFGTAALRTASNGEDFIKKVKAEIGINIQTISGDREAALIYLGTRQAIPTINHNFLIMDIGGGSVEFIIANQHEQLWAKSFPVGVSVLYNQFHKSEPISKNEKDSLIEFLNLELQSLYEALRTFPVQTLVGASGTFEVLSNIIGHPIDNYPNAEIVLLDKFPALYQKVINADLEGRLKMKDIPKQRVKLITVAMILVDLILKKGKIKEMMVSAFAMKEGILMEASRKFN